jgi:hypothetical protein
LDGRASSFFLTGAEEGFEIKSKYIAHTTPLELRITTGNYAQKRELLEPEWEHGRPHMTLNMLSRGFLDVPSLQKESLDFELTVNVDLIPFPELMTTTELDLVT